RKLAELPRPAPAGVSPTNGYHSLIHPDSHAPAWVQVDLGASLPIDEVRLVPARPTDFPDTPGFGFPPAFKVETGDDVTFARATLLVEERRADYEDRGDEPYVLRPKGLTARFVRVTATRLRRRTDDYIFALGELEVLSA